ncbi:hypothetical protein DQ04_08961000 [Trypanosoma grayi]|uniref:hypothetical protein n=1 Tax=Trypanosoma grayi TaxID=71804 RepID=UPI0004F3EFA4|nr:hypothetical protein DQ04_08961000 [Trypanosoma grayi]KEG07729.1 hypothetical protein DQ04_08961000 [Trypanosoma grayi]
MTTTILQQPYPQRPRSGSSVCLVHAQKSLLPSPGFPTDGSSSSSSSSSSNSNKKGMRCHETTAAPFRHSVERRMPRWCHVLPPSSMQNDEAHCGHWRSSCVEVGQARFAACAAPTVDVKPRTPPSCVRRVRFQGDDVKESLPLPARCFIEQLIGFIIPVLLALFFLLVLLH